MPIIQGCFNLLFYFSKYHNYFDVFKDKISIILLQEFFFVNKKNLLAHVCTCGRPLRCSGNVCGALWTPNTPFHDGI